MGGALRIPRVNIVFSGLYGYYYQAPPLSTATGPLLDLANGQNFTFAPLHGERDIQWQYGLTIPYRNWTLNASNYETRAKKWLDHNNIGESNIFWPITWAYAQIQGWQLTLRSPDVFHYGQFHLAYANQIAQATSPITGGLICPAPVTTACGLDIPPGLAPVDHDQRNTLNLGFNGKLPWHAYASTNVYYGSGFTNGLDGTPQAQYPGPTCRAIRHLISRWVRPLLTCPSSLMIRNSVFKGLRPSMTVHDFGRFRECSESTGSTG